MPRVVVSLEISMPGWKCNGKTSFSLFMRALAQRGKTHMMRLEAVGQRPSRGTCAKSLIAGCADAMTPPRGLGSSEWGKEGDGEARAERDEGCDGA